MLHKDVEELLVVGCVAGGSLLLEVGACVFSAFVDASKSVRFLEPFLLLQSFDLEHFQAISVLRIFTVPVIVLFFLFSSFFDLDIGERRRPLYSAEIALGSTRSYRVGQTSLPCFTLLDRLAYERRNLLFIIIPAIVELFILV